MPEVPFSRERNEEARAASERAAEIREKIAKKNREKETPKEERKKSAQEIVEDGRAAESFLEAYEKSDRDKK